MSAEVLVYLPETNKFLYACEGTGDNLLREDIENGYKDYINYNIYSFENEEFIEIDGGMCLLETLVADEFPKGEEERLARYVVQKTYTAGTTFIMLNPCPMGGVE